MSKPSLVLDVAGGDHEPVPSYEFQGHHLTVTRGHPLPLGAAHTPGGVNFVLLCRYGTSVTLVLSEPCNVEISTEIPLDPRNNRTGNHWHIRVHGLPDEFCYGYRVDGPKGVGDRYDPRVVLIDPAARALSCGRFWGAADNLPRRSLVKPEGDGRGPRRHQPVHPARGLDRLRNARPRVHRRPHLGGPAPPAPSPA